MSKPIYEIIDELPTSGMTVRALKALDFVIPGQWENIVGFENTIKTVTGETDESMVQQIGERAIHLYNDKTQGYQTALWIYQKVNSAGGALGSAALANKFTESVSFLSFLSRLTPKADNLQAIDLCLKIVGEVIAYSKINGIPGDGIAEFGGAIADYSSASLMRMAALICFDGVIPLGPDFVLKVEDMVSKFQPSDLTSHPGFSYISNMIPGGSAISQLGFIRESFGSIRDWMGGFVSSNSLTQNVLVSNLQRFIEVSESKLDYVAAFLDMTTNYYEHTGTQTLARSLVERALAEI